MRRHAAGVVLFLAMGGCSESDAPGNLDSGRLDLDASTDLGPATAWDSGLDGRVVRADQFVIDAGPPSGCLADGTPLQPRATSDDLADARRVRVDLDADGDGQPEIAVLRVDAEGAAVHFLAGDDLSDAGRLMLPGAVDATVLPGRWPVAAVQGPIDLDGARVFPVLTRGADGAAALALVPLNGAPLRTLVLPRGADEVVLMQTGGAGWRLLVNEAMGGCAVYGLDDETPLDTEASCRLQPGWDADGDGAIDIVRRSSEAVAVLDAATLTLGLRWGAPYQLGFVPVSTVEGAPTPGPWDVTGEGPALLGALFDAGLSVHVLDPADVALMPEPSTLRGDFGRGAFVLSADGVRLWVEETRNGLRHLRVVSQGRMLRPRGMVGPFTELRWGLGPDVDGDGYREVWVLGGSDATGANTPVRYLDAASGDEVFEIEAERSARFQVGWAAGPHGPTTFDLDACDGDERVVVRVGNGREGGPTPTRLQVLDEAGRTVFRGEGVETWGHQVAVADFDADGRAEVVELIGASEGVARVVVWSTTPGD